MYSKNTTGQNYPSKRKRTSSPIAPAGAASNVINVETDADAKNKIEFFKSKAESEHAKKIKCARAANKYIEESVILNSNVLEIIKICNDGIIDCRNIEFVKTAAESEDLPSKFHNAALKLVAETQKSQGLLTTVNHILAACNKTQERVRAKRIDNIKKEALPSSSRRTVMTSTNSDAKFLKAPKKKIRFSHPIANTQKVEIITIETSDNVEIEIPFSKQPGPNNDTQSLKISFDNIRCEESVKKFRNQMSKETLDLSTFQISQSDSETTNEILNSGKVLSPTKYDESLTFAETDAEIIKEFSTVDSDSFSDTPPTMSDECYKEHELFVAADKKRNCFAQKRFRMKK